MVCSHSHRLTDIHICAPSEGYQLAGTHTDVKRIRNYLVASAQYMEHNIVVMLDDPCRPADEQPTRDNIVRTRSQLLFLDHLVYFFTSCERWIIWLRTLDRGIAYSSTSLDMVRYILE